MVVTAIVVIFSGVAVGGVDKPQGVWTGPISLRSSMQDEKEDIKNHWTTAVAPVMIITQQLSNYCIWWVPLEGVERTDILGVNLENHN